MRRIRTALPEGVTTPEFGLSGVDGADDGDDSTCEMREFSPYEQPDLGPAVGTLSAG